MFSGHTNSPIPWAHKNRIWVWWNPWHLWDSGRLAIHFQLCYKLGELSKFFNFWGPPNSHLDQSGVVIIYSVSRGAGKMQAWCQAYHWPTLLIISRVVIEQRTVEIRFPLWNWFSFVYLGVIGGALFWRYKHSLLQAFKLQGAQASPWGFIEMQILISRSGAPKSLHF